MGKFGLVRQSFQHSALSTGVVPYQPPIISSMAPDDEVDLNHSASFAAFRPHGAPRPEVALVARSVTGRKSGRGHVECSTHARPFHHARVESAEGGGQILVQQRGPVRDIEQRRIGHARTWP